MDELKSLIEKFEKYLTPVVDLAEKTKKGEYPYIPFSMNDFAEQIRTVCGCLNLQWYHDPPKPVFVDVGCGIGTKLLAALEFGGDWNLVGIEITPEYAKVARDLLESANCRAEIREQDALKVDYSSFDVIYFYCPLRDPQKQKQLEKQIIKTAKPGAFVLANMKQSSEENVWQKSPMERRWKNVIYQKVRASS